MNRLEFFKSILLAIPLPEFLVREEKLVKMPREIVKAPPTYTLGFRITKEMIQDDKYADIFKLAKRANEATKLNAEELAKEIFNMPTTYDFDTDSHIKHAT